MNDLDLFENLNEISSILNSSEKSYDLNVLIMSRFDVEQRYEIYDKITKHAIDLIIQNDKDIYNKLKNYFENLFHISESKYFASYQAQRCIANVLSSNTLSKKQKKELLDILKNNGVFDVIKENQKESIDYFNSDRLSNDKKYFYSAYNQYNTIFFLNYKLNSLYGEKILDSTYNISIYEKIFKKMFSELPIKEATSMVKKFNKYSTMINTFNTMKEYINDDKQDKYIDDLIVTYFKKVINGYIYLDSLSFYKDEILINILTKKDDSIFQQKGVYAKLKDLINEVYPKFMKRLNESIYEEYKTRNSSSLLEYYINTTLMKKFIKQDKNDFYDDPYLPMIKSIVYSSKSDQYKENILNLIRKNGMLAYIKGNNNPFEKIPVPDTFESLVTFADSAYKNFKLISIENAKTILRHHILSKEPKVKEGTLKSALISIIQEKLNENGINDHSVLFIAEDTMNSNGRYHKNGKTIFINEKRFQDFYNFNIDSIDFFDSVLTTIYHESKHAVDFKNIDQFSYKNSLILKDNLLENASNDYLKSNYKNLSYECYARKQGIIDTYKLLLELAPDIAKSYLKTSILKIKKENIILSKSIRENSNLLTLFDKYILEHSDKVEQYPILKYEYDSSGNKRKLIDTIDMLVNDNKIKGTELYSYVYNFININFLSQSSNYDFVSEYELLISYSCNDEKVNKIIQLFLEQTKGFYEAKKEKQQTVLEDEMKL